MLMDTNRNATLPLFLDVSVISLILSDHFGVSELICRFVFVFYHFHVNHIAIPQT